MAKTYRFKVTVRGNGQFPVDMLRYDRCWPASEQDSYKMSRDWAEGVRDVVLLTDHDRIWQPTVGRWRSFTWEVVSSELHV
jgi:hypothetical protein